MYVYIEFKGWTIPFRKKSSIIFIQNILDFIFYFWWISCVSSFLRKTRFCSRKSAITSCSGSTLSGFFLNARHFLTSYSVCVLLTKVYLLDSMRNGTLDVVPRGKWFLNFLLSIPELFHILLNDECFIIWTGIKEPICIRVFRRKHFCLLLLKGNDAWFVCFLICCCRIISIILH